MKLNMSPGNFLWVSPYGPNEERGGWKAMQFHLLRALEQQLGPATRIAPVDVPEEFWNKWASRIQKQIHIPRRYAYYSEARLAAFAHAVDSRLPTSGSQPVIFFGALPFVKCQPAGPYFIFTDGGFFIHYWEYNQDHSHDKKDVSRICAAEAAFMRGAAGVWCSSQWVADRIVREYQISPALVRCVGTGPGSVPDPIGPVTYERFLVMIAGDFERKGGRLAAEAVATARKQGTDVCLKFIGAKPPPDVLALKFVEWCGWLDLQKESDRHRFAEILSRAGAQILLSRSDLTPLAIPEAANYCKATFATGVGGIPEMIVDNYTGWLFQPDSTPAEIGKRIADVFGAPHRLPQTGIAAKTFCAERWHWSAVATSAVKHYRSV